MVIERLGAHFMAVSPVLRPIGHSNELWPLLNYLPSESSWPS